MNQMSQCMGGFCRQRERCAHYVAKPNGEEPAERLCERGRDEPTLIERAKRPPPGANLQRWGQWLAGMP